MKNLVFNVELKLFTSKKIKATFGKANNNCVETVILNKYEIWLCASVKNCFDKISPVLLENELIKIRYEDLKSLLSLCIKVDCKNTPPRVLLCCPCTYSKVTGYMRHWWGECTVYCVLYHSFVLISGGRISAGSLCAQLYSEYLESVVCSCFWRYLLHVKSVALILSVGIHSWKFHELKGLYAESFNGISWVYCIARNIVKNVHCFEKDWPFNLRVAGVLGVINKVNPPCNDNVMMYEIIFRTSIFSPNDYSVFLFGTAPSVELFVFWFAAKSGKKIVNPHFNGR